MSTGPLNWFGRMVAGAFVLALLLALGLVIVIQVAQIEDVVK